MKITTRIFYWRILALIYINLSPFILTFCCSYNRGWFYHRDHRFWMTRPKNMEPLVKTNSYERGSYLCFDPNTWQSPRKVCYADLKFILAVDIFIYVWVPWGISICSSCCRITLSFNMKWLRKDPRYLSNSHKYYHHPSPSSHF